MGLLIVIVRKYWQRVEFDAFLRKRFRLLRGCDPINRTGFDLAVMHLARFLRESRPDIDGVAGEVFAQLLELGTELSLLRRQHGNG